MHPAPVGCIKALQHLKLLPLNLHMRIHDHQQAHRPCMNDVIV
jgi:hypothetical protein